MSEEATFDLKGLAPQGERLLVKPVKQEEMTKSGLHLGGIADRNPPCGVVLAIGPDVKLFVEAKDGTRGLRVGDRVVFDRHTEVDYYADVTDSATKMLVVFARNVMLTLPEEK